jgi:lysyl-tRNA synthetase, class II
MSEPGSETSPERESSDLLRERREKLERLREAGVEPFPHAFPGREEIAEVRRAHEGLSSGAETESSHRIAGRIVARRGHGGAAFLDVRDSTGTIQLHAREDLLGSDLFEQLVGLDLGDVVGV